MTTSISWGQKEPHRYPYSDDEGPFDGDAVAVAWVADEADGDKEYLQADETTLGSTPHEFACTVDAEGVAEVVLAATEAMVGRIFTVRCIPDDEDFPAKALNYYVVDDSSASPPEPVPDNPDIEEGGSFPPQP